MNAKMSTNHTESQRMLREMLLRLQNETCTRIKTFRRHQEQESDSDPADQLDLAHTTAEVETHAALIAREEEKLRYLDEALTRLDAGKYGKCLGCGAAILVERLMVIPFASYCVECQKKRNSARLGWGEGTTIVPYDHQWTLPDEMEEPAGREYQSTDPEEQLTFVMASHLLVNSVIRGNILRQKSHDHGARDKASVKRLRAKATVYMPYFSIFA